MTSVCKLTGQPVSEEMKNILGRLNQGEYVSLEEIEATKEIQTANACISNATPTILLKNREDIVLHVFEELQKKGSAVVDENGKMVYNGIVNKCSRLDVIIGLPGSGKSSAITDTISNEFHSRIIDNDDAKKLLPEYNNGWGASVVHKESQVISETQLEIALENNENIVLPKVGSDIGKLQNIIVKAKDLGYEVNLHYVELKREKALARMINRFLEEGRYLSPKLIDKYDNAIEGNKIKRTYEVLKEGGLLNGYSKWNNDVARGENPRLDEWSNCTGSFIDRGRAERAKSEDRRPDRGIGCRGDSSTGRYAGEQGRVENADSKREANASKRDISSDYRTDTSQTHEGGEVDGRALHGRYHGAESGAVGTADRGRTANAGKGDSISGKASAYDRAEQDTSGNDLVSSFKTDLETNGFTITNKLLYNYEKLISGNKHITLREISEEYLAGTENDTINEIGRELEQQELQHKEMEASCDDPGG